MPLQSEPVVIDVESSIPSETGNNAFCHEKREVSSEPTFFRCGTVMRSPAILRCESNADSDSWQNRRWIEPMGI